MCLQHEHRSGPHSSQGCSRGWGYTRVYAAYLPPVISDGVYLPPLSQMDKVYVGIRLEVKIKTPIIN